MNTHTTPTFRVADGMLKENARMASPVYEDYLEGAMPDDTRMTNQRYNIAKLRYVAHLASLRSIPIAPGCVLEGESLVEDIDFVVMEWILDGVRQEGVYAVPPQNPPTPPARAFSLAEALEIWKAGYDYRCSLLSETYCDNLAFGFPDKQTYFKERFNQDI